ncbi:DgyrCDS9064 [Dimorphilus gyrociliatus]|uniref:DgyrCDS9064 n=1 Tax=Dimorphilus gyrociliatus TaxID=2664684 RepID=A0A7I8VY83_9ANNE|nr:DgyrCDS9064 [Dimorphilus gyrociliatus]
MSIKILNRALAAPKARQRFGLVALEGVRLINDALEAKAQLKGIYYSNSETLSRLNIENSSSVPSIKISWKDIKRLSDVDAPTGVIAVFKEPKSWPSNENREQLPLSLICDQIRDPGNMGTLIRTAAACGCKEVLLTKGSTDVWQRKVVRAGAGAHFRIPIRQLPSWPIVLPDNSRIIAADPVSENAIDFKQAHFADRKETFLIIGGETHGISNESFNLVKSFNGLRLNIPCHTNSLNTTIAAGIIMYEIRYQMLKIKDRS